MNRRRLCELVGAGAAIVAAVVLLLGPSAHAGSPTTTTTEATTTTTEPEPDPAPFVPELGECFQLGVFMGTAQDPAQSPSPEFLEWASAAVALPNTGCFQVANVVAAFFFSTADTDRIVASVEGLPGGGGGTLPSIDDSETSTTIEVAAVLAVLLLGFHVVASLRSQ